MANKPQESFPKYSPGGDLGHGSQTRPVLIHGNTNREYAVEVVRARK